jgi:mono/diheme cytochrome c family protein
MLTRFIRRSVPFCLTAFACCFSTSCSVPKYTTENVPLQVQETEPLLARGKALVTMMCADCHTNPVTGQLSGKHLADVPKIMGTLYSKNITQHPQKGTGTYTDGQLAYLLRTGINHQGYLSSIMAKPGISDQDLQAIIAYLKHSPDKMVQAADVESPESKYSAPAKMAFRFKLRPSPYPTHAIATPSLTDKVAYGKYMVRILGCYECHSKSMVSINKEEPEKSKGYMAGGAKLKGLDGKPVRVPNLTMDKETGIGSWTEQEFIKAIRENTAPGNRIITFPMPNYNELSTEEAGAIYAYIQTIPAVRNKVKRNTIPTTENKTTDILATGKQLYARHGCQACHGGDGVGVADLRKAHADFPDDASLEAFIKNPGAARPGTRMPAFGNIIPQEDFKPLLAYVRWLSKAKQ